MVLSLTITTMNASIPTIYFILSNKIHIVVKNDNLERFVECWDTDYKQLLKEFTSSRRKMVINR